MTTDLSEQYKTFELVVTICFSQVGLDREVSEGCSQNASSHSSLLQDEIPELQETSGHGTRLVLRRRITTVAPLVPRASTTLQAGLHAGQWRQARTSRATLFGVSNGGVRGAVMGDNASRHTGGNRERRGNI